MYYNDPDIKLERVQHKHVMSTSPGNSHKLVVITVCTVVQNCCKGDEPCQGNTLIFRPSEIRNPLTDRHET